MRVTHTLTCNYSYWFVLLLSGMCMFSIGLRVKCLNCHNINIHHSMMIKMCCWLPLFIGFVVFAWKTKLNVQTQHLFRFTSLIELINFRISQSHFPKHITQLAHVIREIRHFQQTPYKIEHIPKVTSYLLDSSLLLDDDELYSRSLQIEPRTSRLSAPNTLLVWWENMV